MKKRNRNNYCKETSQFKVVFKDNISYIQQLVYLDLKPSELECWSFIAGHVVNLFTILKHHMSIHS